MEILREQVAGMLGSTMESLEDALVLLQLEKQLLSTRRWRRKGVLTPLYRRG